MRNAISLAVAISVAACGQPVALPTSRDVAGEIELPSWCQDLKELRALPWVVLLRVPRDDPRLPPARHPASPANGTAFPVNSDGRWVAPNLIVVRNDLTGWKKDYTDQHELCHEKTYRMTGSPYFHD